MTSALPRSVLTGLPTIVLPALAAGVWWLATSALGWQGFVPGAALVSAALAAAHDITTHRIPDRLVLLAACPMVVAVVVNSDPVRLGSAFAIGAFAMAGPLLALHLAAPAFIGWGDVKLASVLGSALAVIDVRLGVAALALASGATLIAALLSRCSALPFAPGLVGGSAALLAAASTAALELPR